MRPLVISATFSSTWPVGQEDGNREGREGAGDRERDEQRTPRTRVAPGEQGNAHHRHRRHHEREDLRRDGQAEGNAQDEAARR